jgi:hypothetical protein
VDGQISYLEAQETAVVVNFCMSLLRLYSSNNIGKVISQALCLFSCDTGFCVLDVLDILE